MTSHKVIVGDPAVIRAIKWIVRPFSSIEAPAGQFLDRTGDNPPDRGPQTRLSPMVPAVDVIGLLRKTCKNPSVLHALRYRADACGPVVDKFDAAMVGGRIFNFVPR